jgi:2-polyprenyl-6-methoxyphenol hydroxylase-like FAD-dependent oxidoreductase
MAIRLVKRQKEEIMQQHIPTPGEERTIKEVRHTTCCIVGAGPAGVILALLLARQDIPVLLLEAHTDFDREFRGDTIHPSSLQILDELGLAERLLQFPHSEVHQISGQVGNNTVTLADFSMLKVKYPYIALIPQTTFLDFVVNEARRYPTFQCIMGAQVDELVKEDGRVRGVRYRGVDGYHEVRAVLTVGADGRFSRLRKLAGFEPIKSSPPMDVLWFRLPLKATDPPQPLGRLVDGKVFVMLRRHDHWQIGYVISKGGYQQIRAAGLDALKSTITKSAPLMEDRVDELKTWQQISVLSVESSYVPRWYLSGLLLIGDAAHVMSPVAGVGINYALQDGVVTANVLAGKLRSGVVETHDLAKVQRQRAVSTRIIQALQAFLQSQLLAPMLQGKRAPRVNPVARALLRSRLTRYLTARLVAIGFRQVHVRTQ